MGGALPDGLYEHIVNVGLAEDLAKLESGRTASTAELDPADSHASLARYLVSEVERALETIPHADRPKAQIAIVNHLLNQLQALTPHRDAARQAEIQVTEPGRTLRSIHRIEVPPRPITPLSTSSLLTRVGNDPNLASELSREIESADRIDILVAFINIHGVRVLRDALESFAGRGAGPLRLRVLTTVFTRTTDLEAVELLSRLPGTQVRISYDTERTRLHAKAWLFYRNTGLHSAYVGSANLTSTALGTGHEWMVKICMDLPDVIKKFQGTFETLWNDSEFESFDPTSESSRSRLKKALSPDASRDRQIFFTLKPYPFQEEILDQLATERALHHRARNLVVAATGTGKTVIAAFDYYRQLPASGIPPRLLFLAHRKELLEQAQKTFRNVLHDGAFGELLVQGHEPDHWQHVFATIQSAASQNLLERFGAKHFEYVVVDECHHAPAESYQRLIPQLDPRILLGLTATPERSDGKSLLPDFGDRIAAEMRIWHALERQLLVPFEYYGISDGTDLTRVKWTRTGYDLSALANIYTGNDARVELVLRQLERRCSRLRSIRAIAFCTSVEHAEFMATALTSRGLPALAVHGSTSDAERADAPRRLRELEVNVLCTCDLYNEGVDLPFVDTLLLLRPTASATLFLQQLGRGLRLFKSKSSCLVLDFIGQHRAEFRFDNTLSALTGLPRAKLVKAAEHGFPLLPSGCTLQLDAVARSQVLESLRQYFSRKSRVVEEVREIAAGAQEPLTLTRYLEESGRELEDVYHQGGWTTVRRAAGLLPAGAPEEDKISERLERLLHVDEPTRLRFWVASVVQPALHVPDIGLARLAMLSVQLQPRGELPSAESTLAPFHKCPALRDEFVELSSLLRERVSLASDIFPEPDWPLALHRHYTRQEIMAAVGYIQPGKKAGVPQQGVYKVDVQRELAFITLDKSDHSFSPTTRYRDYAISPSLFHWETQSIVSVNRPSGKRYIESPGNGQKFYLFVRTDTDAPYAFCGPVVYQSHQGDRPIAITWKLTTPLPATLYQRYATLAQG